MDELQVSCPGCGAEYRLGPEFAGRKVECAQCGRKFVVEEGGGQELGSQSSAGSLHPSFGPHPSSDQEREQGENSPNKCAPCAFEPQYAQVVENQGGHIEVHGQGDPPSEGASLQATVPAGGVQATMPAQPARAAGAAAATWQPGDVLLNLYEVKQVFESGGMGLVYRVHHRGWGVDLALKSPRVEYFQTPDHKENFIREAETWVNLGLHPHTVSCYYVREIEGIPRVFAEYVEGGSLSDWIGTGSLYEGEPGKALERMIDVAIQFAWGLHYAHEQGLVHQDVKPGNVMLTAEGVAKVTDFGLAKARAAAGQVTVGGTQRSILVSSGGMTPAYCSPEQANGEPLSRKTDLWSWALSVLEMFTGEVTWMAGQAAAEALEGYLENGAENAAIPKMPPGLVTLLRSCFQGNPDARPKDMLAAAGELQRICREVIGHAYPRQQPKAAEARADALNNRAVSLIDLGQTEQAESLLVEALQLEIDHAEATFNVGLLRWRLGKQTDQSLIEILKKQTNPTPWASWRGWVQLERGDAESALCAFEEARASGQAHSDLWKGFGLALAALGRDDEARESLCKSGDSEARAALDGWVPARIFCQQRLEGINTSLAVGAISPDGQHIIAGSHLGPVLFWKLGEDNQARVGRFHSAAVLEAIFVGREQRLVTAGADGQVAEWNLAEASPAEEFRIAPPNRRITALDRSGRCALFVGMDEQHHLFNFGEESPTELKRGRFTGARKILFLSSAGRVLVLRQHRLESWDLDNQELVDSCDTHEDAINLCLALSDDESLALCGCGDGMIYLWSLRQKRCLQAFAGHRNTVLKVAFGAGEKRFFSVGSDRTVRLWDVASGQCLRTVEQIEASFVVPAAHGDYAAIVVADHVQIWNFPSNSLPPAPLQLCRPKSAVEVIRAETAFQQLLKGAQAELAAQRFDGAYKLARRALDVPGFRRDPAALRLLRDLASIARRTEVRELWERTGVFGHGEAAIEMIALSADERLTVIAGAGQNPCLINLDQTVPPRPVNISRRTIKALAVSPDGRRLAVGGRRSDLAEIAVQTGELLPEHDCAKVTAQVVELAARVLGADHPPARSQITALAYSGDNSLLAAGTEKGEVMVLSTESDVKREAHLDAQKEKQALSSRASGKVRVRYEPSDRPVVQLAFSPANEHLAVLDAAGVLFIWNGRRNLHERRFQLGDGAITCAAFSPGGGYVLAGCKDGRLVLWRLQTGAPAAEWRAGDRQILGVAFSPEGRFIMAVSREGSVTVWQMAELRPGVSMRRVGTPLAFAAVACDASVAMLVPAEGAQEFRLVEVDWELQFPETFPGQAAPIPSGLPFDQPWSGPEKKEQVQAQLMQVIRRRAAPALAVSVLALMISAWFGYDFTIGRWKRHLEIRQQLEEFSLPKTTFSRSAGKVVNVAGDQIKRFSDETFARKQLRRWRNHPDPKVRLGLMRAVAEYGPSTIRASEFIRALGDPDKDIRGFADAALLENNVATSLLLEAVSDANENVRASALQLLGTRAIYSINRIPGNSGDGAPRPTTTYDPKVVAAMRRGFSDPSPLVRIAAAHGFLTHRLDMSAALAALDSALRDSDPQVRLRATQTLSSRGGSEAIPLLEKAASDMNGEVRAIAIPALIQLRAFRPMGISP